MIDLSLKGGVTFPQNSYKSSQEKLHCIENHIGFVVSEILRYPQTDRYPVTFISNVLLN